MEQANQKPNNMEKNINELEVNGVKYVRKDRWIPVKEAIPDEGQYVLARGNGRYFTAMYADGSFVDYWGDDCDFVTHWMPLPSPPNPEQR